MLTLPANIRMYLAEEPVDFRRGFDGLAVIVENQFGLSPLSGHVFIFLNKRRNQVRLLFWERDGFCLISKRLESGTFRRQKRPGGDTTHIEVDTAELVLLLEGIEVTAMRRRKRYVRPMEKKCTSEEKNVH